MQCRSSKLKGRCQSLPGNIWDIWFLSSCFPFSLSTRLSCGWKTAVTVNRHKHDQHSLPLSLQVCSFYQPENIFVINFKCSINTSQLGALKKKKTNNQTTCFKAGDIEVCVPYGATATTTFKCVSRKIQLYAHTYQRVFDIRGSYSHAVPTPLTMCAHQCLLGH